MQMICTTIDLMNVIFLGEMFHCYSLLQRAMIYEAKNKLSKTFERAPNVFLLVLTSFAYHKKYQY